HRAVPESDCYLIGSYYNLVGSYYAVLSKHDIVRSICPMTGPQRALDGPSRHGYAQPELGAHNKKASFLRERGAQMSRPIHSFTLILSLTIPCLLVSTACGGIFVTGHDPDFHAFQGGNSLGSQHIIQQALAFTTNNNVGQVLLVTDLR